MKYRVSIYQDDEYEVMKLVSWARRVDPLGLDTGEYDDAEQSVFIGPLSDCEAYIRLKEQGYM